MTRYLNKGFTANQYLYQGKEYRQEEGLNYYDFHARQYDPALGRFIGTDPARQFASGYVGMGNNPVVGVDPDGEEAVTLASIATAAIVGAVIGAGTSAAVYSANYFILGNGGSGNYWNGLGRSALFGAMAGAISGGVAGGFANSAFINTLGFEIINSTASQTAATISSEGEVSLGTIVGGMAGGFLGASMPAWKGVKGGAFKNILGEVSYPAFKGGFVGAFSGGIKGIIDKDPDGMKWGMINGAISGGTGSLFNIIFMAGYTQLVTEEFENKYSLHKDTNYLKHKNAGTLPAYREMSPISVFRVIGGTDGVALQKSITIDDKYEYKKSIIICIKLC